MRTKPMSTRLNHFCKAIERIVGQAAVSAEWQRELAGEWTWARSLLRPLDQRAGCFPKLEDNPESPAPYRIVWGDEAADLYTGSCPDGTGSIQLRGADLLVYELDRRALAESIASAMDLMFGFTELDEPSRTCRVGTYTSLGINEASVYFTLAKTKGDLNAAVAALALRDSNPFVLVKTTRVTERIGHELLRRQAAVVSLDEIIERDDAGQFRATAGVRELFERLCPQPLGGAGSAVFRRYGKGRLLVYENKTTIVEELKGCEYIAYLLARQCVPHHAGELLAAASDADELANLARDRGQQVFDAVAWKDLREKTRGLLQEMAVARQRNDEAAQERLGTELVAIAVEMERATGKRGRGRRLGDPTDRARKSVCIAIERTLEEIKKVHDPLWRHLDGNIRRGVRLQYDPPTPIDWQL